MLVTIVARQVSDHCVSSHILSEDACFKERADLQYQTMITDKSLFSSIDLAEDFGSVC